MAKIPKATRVQVIGNATIRTYPQGLIRTLNGWSTPLDLQGSKIGGTDYPSVAKAYAAIKAHAIIHIG